MQWICPRLGYYAKVFAGSGGHYVTGCYVGNEPFCTCPDHIYRKHFCKHIRKFLGEVSDKMVYRLELEIERFPSSLDVLNDLYGGRLYNNHEEVAIGGDTNIGKSLFATQEACFLASQGYNVLFIDTEGSAGTMFDDWGDVFAGRFGDDGNGSITQVKKLDYKSLFRFIGWDVEFNFEKSKAEFEINGEIKNPEIEKIIEKKGIDFIIVDSVTKVLKAMTPSRQNFPARASAASTMFGTLNSLMERFNVGILTTHHTSVDPTKPFSSVEDIEISGGSTIFYNSKRILLLDRREFQGKPKKDVQNYRRFWLLRRANMQPYSKAVVAKIDNSGYHDVTDDAKVNECFTTSELARLKEYEEKNE